MAGGSDFSLATLWSRTGTEELELDDDDEARNWELELKNWSKGKFQFQFLFQEIRKIYIEIPKNFDYNFMLKTLSNISNIFAQ